MMLQSLACRFALGQIPADQLPQVAESLLTAGHDVPSLTDLLVCDSQYSSDYRTIIAREERDIPAAAAGVLHAPVP